MKDLAYFVGSCYHEEECAELETQILDEYFHQFHLAFKNRTQPLDIDIQALEENWRSLYPVAWTDFHRFLKGWSPGHWKLTSYSERVAQKVMNAL